MDELMLRQLENYLDGTLTDMQRRDFEARLAGSAELRQAVEQQRKIDSAIKRQFPVGISAGAKAILEKLAHQSKPLEPARRMQPSQRTQHRHAHKANWLQRLAIAALFGSTILAVWANRSYFFPASPYRPVANPISLEKFYQDTIAAGFNPTMPCNNNEDLATELRNRFGQGLMLASLPAAVSVTGLADSTLLSSNTLVLLMKVDGREVIVLVDDIDCAAPGRLSSACKLRAFEMAFGKLKVVEVTPHVESRILELLRIPDASNSPQPGARN